MIIIKRNSETKIFEVEKENASSYDAARLRSNAATITGTDAYYTSNLDETMSVEDVLKEAKNEQTFNLNFKNIWAH